MAWSSGTYTRTNGTYTGAAVWTSDAAASIKILSSRHDTHDQDLAQGINSCLNKNGQNSPSADISWGNYKVTNLANGVTASDAATYGQTITAAAWDSGTSTITLTRAAGNVTVVITGLGSGAWGGITGTLSAQTDLWERLTTLPQVVNSVDRTLALSDIGCHIYCKPPKTLTIPLNSAVAFPIGSVIIVVQDQSAGGYVTITYSGGVSLVKAWDGSSGASVVISNGGVVQLLKVATDKWMISGSNAI